MLDGVEPACVERRVEREREVPGVEDRDVDGGCHQRATQEAEQRADVLPAREPHQHRARRDEHEHRRPQAREEERRREVRDKHVLRHVRAQQLAGELVERAEQPDRDHRHAPVPGGLLAP